MKKKITLLTFILCVSICHAQITFQKTFGGTNQDYGFCVQQTADGGYIIIGNTLSFGAGNGDVYFIRTDANGDTLWTKIYGGSDYEYGNSVQQTADGGFIIAGYAQSFGAGISDVYFIRTDANGDTLWTKTFGGTGIERGWSVQQTADEGFIIAGETGSFGAGNYDAYLIRTDANGDTLWTKTFGGTGFDRGKSVRQTTDGGFIIAGSTESFGAGNGDVYLIRTAPNGDSLWIKTFGGTNNDYGFSVQQTADGGYIISTWTDSFGAGIADVCLIRTDSTGNPLWTKTFGGTDSDLGFSAQQTADGGYIITGYTQSFGAGSRDFYLIRTDANGDTLWTKTVGGPSNDEGFSVQQTADGGFIITGYSQSFGAGIWDAYLIKTDSMGNSGCNDGNPATTVTTPATLVGNPATQVSSGGVVGNPATQTGSGGIVTTLCSITGIEYDIFNPQSAITIFPNPASQYFDITFNKVINSGYINIQNMLGEIILRENILNESTKEINLKNISSGIYFVKVFDGEESYLEKLIIQHD